MPNGESTGVPAGAPLEVVIPDRMWRTGSEEAEAGKGWHDEILSLAGMLPGLSCAASYIFGDRDASGRVSCDTLHCHWLRDVI